MDLRTLLTCVVETDLNLYFEIGLAESDFVSGSIIKGSVTELQRGDIFLFYLYMVTVKVNIPF